MENDNLKKIIGNRINSLLAEQNKTQKELADEIGVKPNVISYFCKGTRTPNTEQIIKIAVFFNTSADYLLGIQKEKTQNKDVTFICKYTGLNEDAVMHFISNAGAKKNLERIDEYSNEYHNYCNICDIRDWIISNGYLFQIATTLGLLNKTSNDVINMKPQKDTLPYDRLYEFYKGLEIHMRFAIEDETLREKIIANNDLLSDLGRLDTICDTTRYKLINIVERMANYFDQREQVKNNGKHQTPKE